MSDCTRGWLRWFLAAVLLTTALIGGAGEALGHARATSFSYWQQNDEEVRGRIVYPWLELQQAFPQLRSREVSDGLADDVVQSELRQFFSARVSLLGECTQAEWQLPVLRDQNAVFEFVALCQTGPSAIEMPLTFAEVPSHVHLIRYERPGEVLKGALTGAETVWPLGSTTAQLLPSGFVEFFRSGFVHILGGLDHLLFLVGLLLLAPSLGALAGLVTGFTLSHSAALVVAVLGLTRPDSATVEALIGFTVAFAALEVFLLLGSEDSKFNRRLRVGVVLFGVLSIALTSIGVFNLQIAALVGTVLFTGSFLWLAGDHVAWRWLLVFFFGFVHGFGFAGPLTELELSRQNFAEALFGFNIGVEAGQLLFIAVTWPLLKGLAKLPHGNAIRAALAAVVLAAGLQWYLLRAVS